MSKVIYVERYTRRKKTSAARTIWCAVTIVLLALIDQFVKYLAVARLKGGDIPIVGNLLHFDYTENTGAAFSILQNRRWLLIAATAVMVVVCLYFLFAHKSQSRLCNFSLILISSGGIGNLIDRVFRGYVVDFIDLRAIHFAIFNVADMFVVVGAVLLCVSLLFCESRRPVGYR